MISKRDAYRGCLLGLAIGDAMGYPVDTKTWQQIQEDYGPYGLMGYDLRNGYAEVSSHTQIAAFSCNGLLLGLTRGQVYGKMAPFVRYAALAQPFLGIPGFGDAPPPLHRHPHGGNPEPRKTWIAGRSRQ